MAEPSPMHEGGAKMNAWRDKWWPKLRLVLILYALMLPTLGTMIVFNYYPKLDVVWRSLYTWQPPDILEYIGLKNFRDAFSDNLFWQSFQLVGIMLVANVVKMWPGIFAAIALHRLVNDKTRYFFQVLFVVPMVIPMMVWLLIWKSFYDPDLGLLNRFLNFTGLMDFLHALDTFMPRVAAGLQPLFTYAVNPVFGGVSGLILFGAFLLALRAYKEPRPKRLRSYGLILALTLVMPFCLLLGVFEGAPGLLIAAAVLVVLSRTMSREMGNAWIIWPFIVIGGTVVYWGELFRLPVMLAFACGINEAIRATQREFRGDASLFKIGLGLVLAGTTLVLLGHVWTEPTHQFRFGTPAWLGSEDLVIPALLLWGFPWVGTIGVLIYLAGLQQIPQDVYEAADLDGIGPVGKLFHIELPLIMTQIRINLIFMTIGTLTGYEMFLILLGPEGGPGNRGMVPGLYMFSQAFSEGRFGFACALGMVLFFMILALTIVYQKYVKVDK
ncbi:MAG: carbohydrate ABC transporter permease [Opitutales bacterium]